MRSFQKRAALEWTSFVEARRDLVERHTNGAKPVLSPPELVASMKRDAGLL